MAAEALSWVEGRMAAVAPVTAWEAPVPTRSTDVGTSIDMTIAARIDMTIVTGTHIATAITRVTPRTVAPAGDGLQKGACGCAATSARTMDIGTAPIARIIATAADTAAIITRPMDVDIAKVALKEPSDDAARPSGSPARRAGEPLRERDGLAVEIDFAGRRACLIHADAVDDRSRTGCRWRWRRTW